MTVSISVSPQGHYVTVERIEENGDKTLLAGPFTGAHHSSLSFNAWKGVSILVTEVEEPEMPQQLIDDNAHLLNPPPVPAVTEPVTPPEHPQPDEFGNLPADPNATPTDHANSGEPNFNQ